MESVWRCGGLILALLVLAAHVPDTGGKKFRRVPVPRDPQGQVDTRPNARSMEAFSADSRRLEEHVDKDYSWYEENTLRFYNRVSRMCPHGTVYRADCRICFCMETQLGRVTLRCDSAYTKEECEAVSQDVHCDSRKLLYDYNEKCEGPCRCFSSLKNITSCVYLPCNDTLLWFHGYYSMANKMTTKPPPTTTIKVKLPATNIMIKNPPPVTIANPRPPTTTSATRALITTGASTVQAITTIVTTERVTTPPPPPLPPPPRASPGVGNRNTSSFWDGFNIIINLDTDKYRFKEPGGTEVDSIKVRVIPKRCPRRNKTSVTTPSG